MWVYLVLNDSNFNSAIEGIFLTEEEARDYIDEQAMKLYFQYEESAQEEAARRSDVESFTLSDLNVEESEYLDRTSLDERAFMLIDFFIAWNWTIIYKSSDYPQFTETERRRLKLLKWCVL